MLDYPNEIQGGDFKERVLKSDRPVLVLFVTTNAIPCRQMVQPLCSIIDDFYGKVNVFSLNADRGDNVKIAKEYGIRGVPTMMVFKDGESVNLSVGFAEKIQIVAFINNHI
jgi:thioredoxin 1